MKRLNTRLLAWLVSGVLVLLMGMFVLHAYQMRVNAAQLSKKAEDAESKGEIGRAAKHYRELLKHQRGPEIAEKLNAIYQKRLKDRDVQPLDHLRDYQSLQELVRLFPTMKAVRETAIDHAFFLGLRFADQGPRINDAMTMIEDLFQQSDERDPEMELKYAQCLTAMRAYDKAVPALKALVGYDDQTRKFRANARGAKLVNAYTLLATILELQKNPGNQKTIEKLLERMVEANPDSFEAYLRRGEYYRGNQRAPELAEPDLLKAYELNPHDTETSIGAARVALQHKEWARADEILTQAIAEHGDEEALYWLWTASADAQGHHDEAISRCNQGLQAVPKSILLYSELAATHLAGQHFDEIPAILRKLTELNAPVGRKLLIEGQFALAQRHWVEAATKYEQLRTRNFREFSNDPSDAIESIELPLAQCYEVLQQHDKTVTAARRVLEANPRSVQARLLLDRALKRTRQVNNQPPIELAELGEISGELQQREGLVRAVAEQLAKPDVSQRDWSRADELAREIIDDTSLPEVSRAMVRVTMLLAKEQREAGRKLLAQLAKQHPQEVAPWLTLIRMEAEDGNQTAVERLIDAAEKKAGKRAAFRAARLSVLARKGLDALQAGLPAIEEGIDELPAPERAGLLKTVGLYYLQVRDYPNAKRCWQAVAKLSPNDLRHRQQMFDLAQSENDLDGMNWAIDSIKAAAGTDGDLAKDLIFYCEAGRILWQVDQKQKPKSALNDVRRMVEEARRIRPEWHELFKLEAHLDEMEGNVAEAIDNYKLAIDKGTTNAAVPRQLLRLLFARGRFEEAAATLPHILPRLAAGDPFEKMVAEVMFRTGGADGPDQALRFVERRTELARTPQNLSWYGLYLQRAGKMDEAEKAFRESVELEPSYAQGWILLVTNLQEQRQPDEAEAAVEQAKAALSGEDANLAFAQMHEVTGDAAAAERYYLQAAKTAPADAGLAQALAQFYLRSNRGEEAERIFMQILQSDEPSSAPLKPAIRRTVAQMIAGRRGYANVKRAVALLDQNAVNGQLPLEDLLLQARLWSDRPEMALKHRAAAIYEEVQKTQTLTPEQQLALALLLESTGQWKKSREQMQNLLSRDSRNTLYLAGFARMLLEHEEQSDEVGGLLDQLDEIDPEFSATKELRAWYLVKQGHRSEAQQLLGNLVPRPLRPNQVNELARVSLLYEQLGFLDEAGKLLREYVELEPRAALELGRYLGRHGDLDEAFALMDQARSSQPIGRVVQVGLSTLQARMEEARPEHYRRVETWINEGAEAEDEDALKNREIQLAALLEMQGQFEAVVKNYRAFLLRDDANEIEKAVVKNNLAAVVALEPSLALDGEEAVRLANEAIDILGETSDLLDTRGVALCAAGQAKAAQIDLRNAVRAVPSAIKYAHLAWINYQLQDVQAARDAFRQANEMKLNLRQVSSLDRRLLTKVKTDLGL